MRYVVSLVGWVVVAVLVSGCESPPPRQPSVTSYPNGAEVYIKRYGDRRVESNAGGIGVTAEGGGKFEEREFTFIGITPLDYIFPRSEREAGVRVMGLGGSDVIKNYRGATIRVVLPGHKTHESKIKFGRPGNFLVFTCKLEKEGGAEPADEKRPKPKPKPKPKAPGGGN